MPHRSVAELLVDADDLLAGIDWSALDGVAASLEDPIARAAARSTLRKARTRVKNARLNQNEARRRLGCELDDHPKEV